MLFLKTALIALIFCIAFPAWSKEPQAVSGAVESETAALLSEGMRAMKSGKPAEAITSFDAVITLFENQYKGDATRFYGARTPAETLAYLMEAASKKMGPAKVVSGDWAYAYYFKAYSLIELGRLAEARQSLAQALALSPLNAQFLLEQAYVYQREKNWEQALQTFQRAEAAAGEYSPPKLKNSELARSWRGIGYVYIELNRLDEAEKMYEKCLELDKNDAKAQNEMRYISMLRAKQRR